MPNAYKFSGVLTHVFYEEDGSVRGVYRGTAVCVMSKDGKVRLWSGGYRTYTTKLRMNQFSNQFCNGRFSVYQKGGNWFVTTKDGTIPFVDGMEV